jgi:hypothetical protein
MRLDEALAAASANLRSIEDGCRRELDDRLARVLAFARRDPSTRPSETELADLAHDVDRALTACGGLNLPLLGKALIVLSAMADALSQTLYWPSGALTPAINLVALFRNGGIEEAEGNLLLDQLHLCLAQYLRHAGET